jgi:hypothetical protein
MTTRLMRSAQGRSVRPPGAPRAAARMARLHAWARARAAAVRARGDAGLATAEYAIATVAACGFAGLLVAIMKSSEVRGMLLSIIKSALSLG